MVDRVDAYDCPNSEDALAAVESCSTEDQALVAHWKFDEGAGDVVKDSSGNENDGIIRPTDTSEPKWGTGQFVGSISGGSDHFVRVPPSASLNSLKKQITVVAYIYPRTLWVPTEPSTVERLWTKAIRLARKILAFGRERRPPVTPFIAIAQRQWGETVHPDQYYLGYGRRNDVLHYKWHLGLLDGEISLYRLPEDQPKPPTGSWVHLAGTYNGETGNMSIYVGGKLIGTRTHIGEIRLDQDSLNRQLAIGAELNGASIDEPSGVFDGYISDVRIYNRALSERAIKELYEEAENQVISERP